MDSYRPPQLAKGFQSSRHKLPGRHVEVHLPSRNEPNVLNKTASAFKMSTLEGALGTRSIKHFCVYTQLNSTGGTQKDTTKGNMHSAQNSSGNWNIIPLFVILFWNLYQNVHKALDWIFAVGADSQDLLGSNIRHPYSWLVQRYGQTLTGKLLTALGRDSHLSAFSNSFAHELVFLHVGFLHLSRNTCD